jgi:hypothetical protein
MFKILKKSKILKIKIKLNKYKFLKKKETKRKKKVLIPRTQRKSNKNIIVEI